MNDSAKLADDPSDLKRSSITPNVKKSVKINVEKCKNTMYMTPIYTVHLFDSNTVDCGPQ